MAWIPEDEVSALPLHPGFAAAWPALQAAIQPVTVLVDVANVMGARPDGWWRDRAGAAARLHGDLAALAARGITALPPGVRAGRWPAGSRGTSWCWRGRPGRRRDPCRRTPG